MGGKSLNNSEFITQLSQSIFCLYRYRVNKNSISLNSLLDIISSTLKFLRFFVLFCLAEKSKVLPFYMYVCNSQVAISNSFLVLLFDLRMTRADSFQKGESRTRNLDWICIRKWNKKKMQLGKVVQKMINASVPNWLWLLQVPTF